MELLKKEGYNIDFSARTIYHKGDAKRQRLCIEPLYKNVGRYLNPDIGEE